MLEFLAGCCVGFTYACGAVEAWTGGEGVVVATHVSGYHERHFDVELVDFVEHGFDESFDGIFGCAVGA